jgi:hypothetical protein
MGKKWKPIKNFVTYFSFHQKIIGLKYIILQFPNSFNEINEKNICKTHRIVLSTKSIYSIGFFLP